MGQFGTFFEFPLKTFRGMKVLEFLTILGKFCAFREKFLKIVIQNKNLNSVKQPLSFGKKIGAGT